MFAIYRIAFTALLSIAAAVPLTVQAADNWVEPTFTPGRSNYANSYRPVAAIRSGDVVSLSGLLVNRAHGHVLTLPRDMRPKRRLIFAANVHDGTARIDVAPDGKVSMDAGNTGYGWVSLDGISFSLGRSDAIVLRDNWRNYGNGYADAGASLDGDTVYLGGLVVPGSGNVIGTLPTNLRPPHKMTFNVNASEKSGRVDIHPNGEVVSTFRIPNTQWVSLDGISFTRKTDGRLPLAGGWRDWGGDWAPATVTRRGQRISISGMIKAPSSTWSHIATLPKGLCPEERLIFDLNNNIRSSRLDVLADCRIFWVGGGHDHGWLSLNGLAFYLKPAEPTGERTGETAGSGGGSPNYSGAENTLIDSAGALVEALNIPVLKDNWLDWKDRFGKDGEMLKLDVKILNQNATVAVYRPKGKGPRDPVNVAVMTDNFKISNLIAAAEDTFADDLQVDKVTYIFAPQANAENINTSDLPKRIRDHVQQVRTGPIEIVGGQNLFGVVNVRDNGETARFLKLVNVPLDGLKVNAGYGMLLSRKTGELAPYKAVRLSRSDTVDQPFKMKNLKLTKPTFEFAEENQRKVFRGWGIATVERRNKSYFLFAQKTGTEGPWPTAVAVNAAEMTMNDALYMNFIFADAMFKGIAAYETVWDKTRPIWRILDEVKVRNPKYTPAGSIDADGNPVFDNALIMAASAEDELPDGGHTQGPAFIANGTGEVLHLNAGTVAARIIGTEDLEITGSNVKLTPMNGISFGTMDFHVFRDGDDFAADITGKASYKLGSQKILDDTKVTFNVSDSGVSYTAKAVCPFQPMDIRFSADSLNLVHSGFMVIPSLGCDPLDMIRDLLAAGQEIVEIGSQVGNIMTQNVSRETWRGLQAFAGGSITPHSITNAIREYGDPKKAVNKFADTGKKIVDGATSVFKSWFSGGGSDGPEPIYNDDPKDCQKGQKWSIEFGTCWTPGAELIRLAKKPTLCISIRHRYREKGKGIELWDCVGDWHQQWRTGWYSSILDGLEDGFCWEQDRGHLSIESRPCSSREPQQQFYRDDKDRIVVTHPPDSVPTFSGPGFNGKTCLTALDAWPDANIMMMPCNDDEPLQKWVFMTRNSFKPR